MTKQAMRMKQWFKQIKKDDSLIRWLVYELHFWLPYVTETFEALVAE